VVWQWRSIARVSEVTSASGEAPDVIRDTRRYRACVASDPTRRSMIHLMPLRGAQLERVVATLSLVAELADRIDVVDDSRCT
jgi:hypothetical protein